MLEGHPEVKACSPRELRGLGEGEGSDVEKGVREQRVRTMD